MERCTYRINVEEGGHICATMCAGGGGGSALLNSEAREWSRVLLFHHRRPRGSCDKRRGELSVEEALGSNPLPHPPLFCNFFVFILYSSPSSLFLTPFPTFSSRWWKFFPSQYWEILPVQQKHDGMLREEPQAKLKSAWSPLSFFFPSFFWTTLVKVCFIYTAASHNKSDLMTLSKYSRSRFKS